MPSDRDGSPAATSLREPPRRCTVRNRGGSGGAGPLYEVTLDLAAGGVQEGLERVVLGINLDRDSIETLERSRLRFGIGSRGGRVAMARQD